MQLCQVPGLQAYVKHGFLLLLKCFLLIEGGKVDCKYSVTHSCSNRKKTNKQTKAKNTPLPKPQPLTLILHTYKENDSISNYDKLKTKSVSVLNIILKMKHSLKPSRQGLHSNQHYISHQHFFPQSLKLRILKP